MHASKVFQHITAFVIVSSLLAEIISTAHVNDERPCSYNQSDYSLEWGYDAETDRVIFSLRAKTDRHEFLTGFAFGSKKKMDLLGIYVEKGKLGIIDAHLTRSGVVEKDAVDNTDSITFDYDKGLVKAEIARTLKASDRDQDVDLSGCVIFYFPSGNSVFNTKHKTGGKLGETTEKEVCDIVDKCSLNDNGERKSDLKRIEDEEDKNKNEDESSDVNQECSYNGDNFTLKWQFDENKETVIFDLQQDVVKGKRYSSIGIGSELKDLDIVTIFFNEDKVSSIYDYHTDRHGTPKKDKIQHWTIETNETLDDDQQIHVQFSRKLVTGDQKDKSLDGCVTLQLAINAGTYENELKFKEHLNKPIAYRVCDIRSKCQLSLASPLPTSSPESDNSDHLPSATESDGESTQQNESTSGEVEEEERATGESDEKVVEPEEQLDEGTTTEKVASETGKTTELPEETTTLSLEDQESTQSSTSEASEASEEEGNENIEEKSENAEEESEGAEEIKIPQKECPPDHEDLKICKKYFDEYYEKVAIWAKKHDEKMEAQNWKACSLLSKVPHVPTLCCKTFTQKCAKYIDDHKSA